MSRPLRLETPGFVLRCWQPGDGPALHRAVAASRMHLMPWMPWAGGHQSPQESEEWVVSAQARFLEEQEFALAVFGRDGQVIGGTGYHLPRGMMSAGNLEIGMWIHQDYAGQGLGYKVLLALLGWGFDGWDLHRQFWRCDTLNYASVALARKMGMVQEGLFVQDRINHAGQRVDSVEFAALKGRWRAPE